MNQENEQDTISGAARRIDEIMTRAEAYRETLNNRHTYQQPNRDIEPAYHNALLELHQKINPYIDKILRRKNQREKTEPTQAEKIWLNKKYPIKTAKNNNAICINTKTTHPITKNRYNNEKKISRQLNIDYKPKINPIFELTGLKDMKHIRDLTTQVEKKAGTISNPDKTKKIYESDWLQKETLYDIHNDLYILIDKLGLGANIKEKPHETKLTKELIEEAIENVKENNQDLMDR